MDCPAALINPAADPTRDLAWHIGAQTRRYDAAQTFFRASLHRRASGHGLRPGTTPARTLVLIAQGDEVSDWREMAACCIKAQVQRTEGSEHTLSDFDAHLPASLIFCISPDAQAVAQTP